MTENKTPRCSCGDSSDTNKIIFPCSGHANTGQVTNLAAIQLTEEGFGSAACIALLASGAKDIIKSAKDADEIVILDGCPMQCAKKIAESKNIPVSRHLVVTELGQKKGKPKDFTDDDVETVVSALWEGKGKTGK
ncbi:putative metal-binding protein [Methanomicrobium sp. W14]|uniref:putative zinc-binding protein n=1 Tax=Methanomicrobium sp. W14 TaxID=2817839 RepID=UPI001AE97022|nr:putative zinc-binding protein [Methanomicrobium sp. W14]MBP2133960.1 putative metal-binding protein [Methanomicrobium sp. W14]